MLGESYREEGMRGVCLQRRHSWGESELGGSRTHHKGEEP